MENELLLNIADKLGRGKPMEIDKWDLDNNQPFYGSGGVNEWQLERLKELGGLNEENAKIIAKYSGKTEKKVEKVFQRAREIGTKVDKDILDLGIKAGILNEINPYLEDIIVKNILGNAILETLTTFNKQNNSLLASAGNSYRNIVNKVSSQVLAGTKTTAKAMQEAVSKLAEKGLTGFTARNGAEWSSEAYTKMVIRANTRNTINRIQEERMRLAGNDYVEISSHLGARPLCSEDQGKIFSLSGNTSPIKDGLGNSIKVYSWSNSSYGKPNGILGINCGHSRYAFVPGLSIHRKKDFSKKENDEAYIEKQNQRLYERSIRNKKREIEMLKKTGAEADYISQKKRQLSDYRNQYLDFLKKTGRTRISANEWIGNSSISRLSINKSINSTSTRKFIENIDLKAVDKKLKEYENSIYKNDFETAFVIQANGDVYKFIGKTESVNIFDVIFENAIITHNHPIDYDTYRSFGEDDFDFIKSKPLNITLRVVTLEFTAIVKKIKDIDIGYNDIYKEAMQRCFMDSSLEIQDEAMKILKDKGYIEYERRTR